MSRKLPLTSPSVARRKKGDNPSEEGHVKEINNVVKRMDHGQGRDRSEMGGKDAGLT